MPRLIAALLLAIFVTAVSASAQEAEKALKEYEGKLLVLRHPLEESSLRYNADGKVLKGGPNESWTTNGVILVDRIELAPDKILVKGRRILVLFKKDGLYLMEFRHLNDRPETSFTSHVKTEIKLDGPIDSAERARTVLNRVFAMNTADFLESLPDYWRADLAGHVRFDSSKPKDEEFYWHDKRDEALIPRQISMSTDRTASGDAGPQKMIYHIGKDDNVKRPEAIFTPAPEFTEVARYEGYQGAVVLNLIIDTDGRVSNIRFIRSMGMGLDENARTTVMAWKFMPATHNGQPVAVEMNVEVAFHLY